MNVKKTYLIFGVLLAICIIIIGGAKYFSSQETPASNNSNQFPNDKKATETEKLAAGDKYTINWKPGPPGIWEVDLVDKNTGGEDIILFMGDPIRPPGDMSGSRTIRMP